MDTKVEPPPDFLATKTAASVGRCCPTLMSGAIFHFTMPEAKRNTNDVVDRNRQPVKFTT